MDELYLDVCTYMYFFNQPKHLASVITERALGFLNFIDYLDNVCLR